MPEVLLAERNGKGGVGRLDIAAARRRLEDVLDELDRSVAVLDGAHQRHPLVADYPQDPADAGTNLAESDRADTVLDAEYRQPLLARDPLDTPGNGTYMVCVDCGKLLAHGMLVVKP